MTANEIREVLFDKAKHGYNIDQVDEILDKVATCIEDLEKEKEDLNYKIQLLAEKVKEYKAEEENIHEALLGAQKMGSTILAEAKAKAEKVVSEAQTTYDEMMSQAKQKVDSLTKDSLHKANLELMDLKRECNNQERLFEKKKKEVSAFRATILKQYKAHLDLLANLPVEDYEARESSPASETSAAVEPSAGITEETNSTKPASIVKEETIEETEFKNIEASESTRELADVAQAAVEQADAVRGFIEPKSAFDFEKSEVTDMDSSKEENDNALKSSFENEILEHTKEFSAGEEATDVEKEASATETKPYRRTNYIEKFGELKFGEFNDDK